MLILPRNSDEMNNNDEEFASQTHSDDSTPSLSHSLRPCKHKVVAPPNQIDKADGLELILNGHGFEERQTIIGMHLEKIH